MDLTFVPLIVVIKSGRVIRVLGFLGKINLGGRKGIRVIFYYMFDLGMSVLTGVVGYGLDPSKGRIGPCIFGLG